METTGNVLIKDQEIIKNPSINWDYSMDWVYFGALSAVLLFAALIVLKAPLYLRRPLAFGMVVIAFLVNSYGFSPTVGLERFVPFLFIKLIASHALREEPYRPDMENVSVSS